jgi:hypothetical protein
MRQIPHSRASETRPSAKNTAGTNLHPKAIRTVNGAFWSLWGDGMSVAEGTAERERGELERRSNRERRVPAGTPVKHWRVTKLRDDHGRL